MIFAAEIVSGSDQPKGLELSIVQWT